MIKDQDDDEFSSDGDLMEAETIAQEPPNSDVKMMSPDEITKMAVIEETLPTTSDEEMDICGPSQLAEVNAVNQMELDQCAKSEKNVKSSGEEKMSVDEINEKNATQNDKALVLSQDLFQDCDTESEIPNSPEMVSSSFPFKVNRLVRKKAAPEIEEIEELTPHTFMYEPTAVVDSDSAVVSNEFANLSADELINMSAQQTQHINALFVEVKASE